ncbi:MAG: uncharacterized protein KVP18_002518 [Porospora cf. gigantea A]|nr:MAG: hypothetical protein KVP18_002518 [Porospora cf. gigantea A]
MPRRFLDQATLMRNHVRTFGKILRGILAGDPDARQEIKAFLDPSPDLEMQLGWHQDAFPFGVYSIPCRQYVRVGGILTCWTLKTTNKNNKAFFFWRANGSLTKLIYSIREHAGAGERELFLLSDVRTNLWTATMRVDKGREAWPPLQSGSRNWPQDRCFSLTGHKNRNPAAEEKPTVLCLKAEDSHERDLLMEIMALWCLGLAAT